ncbi:MAG: hypothetical protein IIB89_11185, partial [Chloroflexi bacterium]|nr:hypothetical protein [Chloroflexota bacterium]
PVLEKTGIPYYFDSTQGNSGSESDAFFAEFNSAAEPEWATYYGGSGNALQFIEAANDLTVISANYLYVVGSTNSLDLEFD